VLVHRVFGKQGPQFGSLADVDRDPHGYRGGGTAAAAFELVLLRPGDSHVAERSPLRWSWRPTSSSGRALTSTGRRRAATLLSTPERAVVASAWNADDGAAAFCVILMLRELGPSADAAPAAAQRIVATVTARQLAALASDRLAHRPGRSWLPYDLAIELDALLARLGTHPDAPVFAHPTRWGALCVLGA
jgi:hypothetical protein